MPDAGTHMGERYRLAKGQVVVTFDDRVNLIRSLDPRLETPRDEIVNVDGTAPTLVRVCGWEGRERGQC